MQPDLIEELARVMFSSDGICSDHDWGNANEDARAHFRIQAQAIAPIIARLTAEARAKALDEAAGAAFDRLHPHPNQPESDWTEFAKQRAIAAMLARNAIRNLKGTDNG